MALDDVWRSNAKPGAHHIGMHRQAGGDAVHQAGHPDDRWLLARQILHHLQQRMPGVQNVIHDQHRVPAQIQRRMLRLLGQQGLWMEQRKVVCIALDLQIQPQGLWQPIQLHHPRGQTICQRCASAQHANHGHLAGSIEQAVGLPCHFVDDGHQLRRVVQGDSRA